MRHRRGHRRQYPVGCPECGSLDVEYGFLRRGRSRRRQGGISITCRNCDAVLHLNASLIAAFLCVVLMIGLFLFAALPVSLDTVFIVLGLSALLYGRAALAKGVLVHKGKRWKKERR